MLEFDCKTCRVRVVDITGDVGDTGECLTCKAIRVYKLPPEVARALRGDRRESSTGAVSVEND